MTLNLKPDDLRINKFGWTSLHAACYFGRVEIVKYLIEEVRADPNQRNPNGWHSLIFAVMGGHGQPIVDYLVNLTAVDFSIRDNSGNSALVYAESIYPNGDVA
jgi:ankyrin repeat protein